MKLPELRFDVTRVVLSKRDSHWNVRFFSGNHVLHDEPYRTKQVAKAVCRACKKVYGAKVVELGG